LNDKVARQPVKASSKPWVALIGNPNSGKTALFNQLTGLHQRVGNYPGITVEQKVGMLKLGQGSQVELHDLPGSYSLSPQSLDEEIVTDIVFDSLFAGRKPLAFLLVLDATNLERNLFLAGQVIETGIPVVIALNMYDLLQRKGQALDYAALGRALGAYRIIPTVATGSKGLNELRQAIEEVILEPPQNNSKLLWQAPAHYREAAQPVVDWLTSESKFSASVAASIALRLIANGESKRRLFAYLRQTAEVSPEAIDRLREAFQNARDQLRHSDLIPQSAEARLRYAHIDQLLSQHLHKRHENGRERSLLVDRILTHKIWGLAIFIFVMGGIFQAIFSLAQFPMDWIESVFISFGTWVEGQLPPGNLRDLVSEGIIGGVGGILIFLPQILILTFLLGILEDSGYMSRAAFLMDKLFARLGISGRSVVPLLNGYACAIPAIMATRTIKNWEDRLITILIIPLMSCSARLPIYVLMIAAFVPNSFIFGFIPLQGMAMFALYALGTLTAGLVAWLLKRFVIKPPGFSFVMELPPYRIPHLQSIIWQVYDKGKSFVINAGQIILAISIILWFLASFPKNEAGQSDISNSYAAAIGKTLEPAIEPLGFDWKIGIGLVTSFAAREVIISTMNTIYKVEGDNDKRLIEAIRSDIDPQTGKPVFSLLTVFSLLIFYVYAAQCMATFAVVRKETNSWKWPLFMIVYMTALAYGASLLFYQVGSIWLA
jgi:ferrous iron transport protein B